MRPSLRFHPQRGVKDMISIRSAFDCLSGDGGVIRYLQLAMQFGGNRWFFLWYLPAIARIVLMKWIDTHFIPLVSKYALWSLEKRSKGTASRKWSKPWIWARPLAVKYIERLSITPSLPLPQRDSLIPAIAEDVINIPVYPHVAPCSLRCQPRRALVGFGNRDFDLLEKLLCGYCLCHASPPQVFLIIVILQHLYWHTAIANASKKCASCNFYYLGYWHPAIASCR